MLDGRRFSRSGPQVRSSRPSPIVSMKKHSARGNSSGNARLNVAFWTTLLLIPAACSSFVFGGERRTAWVTTNRHKFRRRAVLLPTPSSLSTVLLPLPSCSSGLIILRSWSLTSALESLAEEDDDDTSSSYFLKWLDPAAAGASDDQPETASSSLPVRPRFISNSSTAQTTSSNSTTMMPLYPLPAVYLPTGNLSSPCLLRNTEQRNVQMALDVGVGGEFCVVFRAMDTGRMATHGTVMRLLDINVPPRTRMKSTLNNDDNDDSTTTIQRILVTCRPERIVEIARIENPQAASLEYRLRHPRQYLKAIVQTPTAHQHDNNNHRGRLDQRKNNTVHDSVNDLSILCHDIQQNYQAVRQFYLDGIADRESTWGKLEELGQWARGLPEKLPLPCLGDDDMIVDTQQQQLWKTMEIWQTLCETVREVRQRRLVADRNELLVKMALQRQNGKPLRLPIRLEDGVWLPEDRRRVPELEIRAQQSWWDLRLDPCLDFQTLLTLPSWSERLQHLQRMVARERWRLEEQAASSSRSGSGSGISLQMASTTTDKSWTDEVKEDNATETTRKGAWFDDDFW